MGATFSQEYSPWWIDYALEENHISKNIWEIQISLDGEKKDTTLGDQGNGVHFEKVVGVREREYDQNIFCEILKEWIKIGKKCVIKLASSSHVFSCKPGSFHSYTYYKMF